MAGTLACALTATVLPAQSAAPSVGQSANLLSRSASQGQGLQARSGACSDPDDARVNTRQALRRDRLTTRDDDRQTSDGVPGLVVGPPVGEANGRSVDGRSVDGRSVDGRVKGRARRDATHVIAPGITLREWDQVDGRQPIGQVRANLVTVDLDAPNISFEYLASKYVPARKPVSKLGQMVGGIVAVNGDFFDICDTGAPLGAGFRAGHGLVQGPKEGWIPENMSMWFDDNEPAMGPISVQWQIRQRQRWPLAGVNIPTIPAGELGLYTYEWGRTEGYSVTGGKRRAREVVIRKNRIISNRYKLSDGRKIRRKDKVLVAVGKAAGKLKRLRIGKRITFRKRTEGANANRAEVAITGDRPILVNGVRTVINDRLAHPRTAVGIDADGRKLLILVIDGRSSSSRGYTMVELADMMLALGAENALNLDGGGSSTMWGRTSSGQLGLINEPSDGQERLVPNGLGVVYHGALPPVVPVTPTP